MRSCNELVLLEWDRETNKTLQKEPKRIKQAKVEQDNRKNKKP